MAVTTSVSPYFDDFSEDKNFHRVLFKPGVAVQSRELTQSQTILQNQIKRVGDYLFKDGDKVKGSKPSVNLDVRTVRLQTQDIRGVAIDINNFLNTYVTTATSDVLGYVEFVFEADDPNIGDLPSLVISLKKYSTTDDGMFDQDTELYFYTDYTEALNKTSPTYTALTALDITKNAISTTRPYSTSITLTNPSTIIEVGDLLVHPSITKKIYVTKVQSTIEIIVNEAPGVTIGSENISYVKKATCPSVILTQDESIFYKNGYLVKCSKQKIVPDKNTSYPSKLIALITEEEIITSSDDDSLLDPAIGSSNYFASGADRLKISLTLTSLDLDADDKADTNADFIPLLKFNKGQIEYLRELSNDSVLQSKLAERTYDESGSYIVKPFIVTPANSLEGNSELRFNVSAGKAYVGGYPVTTVGSTEIIIPKSSTTETKTNYNLTTTQGNYFRVSNVVNKVPKVQEIIQGESFLELHNVRHPANANTRVGIVSFKNLEYDSSLGLDTQFRFFYRSLSLEKEVPASWEAWATKYGISSAEGQYIANVLYTNNSLLGNYGAASTPFYGLFREPDVTGVAYWWNRWVAANKDISVVKSEFAQSFTTTSSDYARVRSNSKSYLEVQNNSPFIDGLQNVNKIKSIVGVNNSFTQHYTGATYVSPFFYADIADTGLDTNGEIVVFDPRPADTLIFPTAKSYVKNVDRIYTSYNRVIQNAIFSGGKYTKTLSLPETFPLGDGIVVASTARTNFSVLVKSGNTANVGLGVFNFEKGSVTIQGDSATAVIDLGDAGFTGVADIVHVTENDNLAARTKAITYNQTKLLNINTADLEYSLGVSDIVAFNGVYKLSNVNAYLGAWSPTTSYNYNDVVMSAGAVYLAAQPTTNVSVAYGNAWSIITTENFKNYILDNGQRDGYYDHGSVKYIGASTGLPGNVLVVFNYFTHSGEGPCTVDSYPATYYSKIPTYTSTIDSKPYNLRDCIDFRPRRKDDSNYYDFDPAIFPTSSVNTEVNITYYLGRRDRIYVTNTLQNFDSPYNKFYVAKGTEQINPKELQDESDLSKLSIATLEIPAYCVSAFDVKITYDDNKRFTMKDISKLQKTTIALDKAVKLHSIEIANLKGTITNDAGAALLKSGVLVEDFSTLDKADLTGGYFSAAINKGEKTCYPLFSAYNLNLDLIADDDIYVQDDIITMKYIEEVLASQLEANGYINANPGAVNDRRGRAVLSEKNSMAVNLFLTGGLLLTGYIAAQTYAAFTQYAALGAEGTAAFLGIGEGSSALASVYANGGAVTFESVLSAAWGAVRDLGYSFAESVQNIDSLSGFVNAGLTPIQDAGQWVLNFFGGGGTGAASTGAVSLINGNYWVESSTGTYISLLESAGYTNAIGATTSAAFSSLTGTISQMLGGELTLAQSASGLASGLSSLSNSIGHEGFSLISQGASALSASLTEAGILSAETGAAISAGIADGLAFAEAIPVLGPALATAAVIYVASEVIEWAEDHKEEAVGLGALIGWALFSDEETKENVILIGKDDTGLNLYSYNYKQEYQNNPLAGPGRWIGYMAKEVEKLYPNAIKIDTSGFKTVNYSLIGI